MSGRLLCSIFAGSLWCVGCTCQNTAVSQLQDGLPTDGRHATVEKSVTSEVVVTGYLDNQAGESGKLNYGNETTSDGRVCPVSHEVYYWDSMSPRGLGIAIASKFFQGEYLTGFVRFPVRGIVTITCRREGKGLPPNAVRSEERHNQT